MKDRNSFEAFSSFEVGLTFQAACCGWIDAKAGGRDAAVTVFAAHAAGHCQSARGSSNLRLPLLFATAIGEFEISL
jgi:hypothetical protein